MDLSKVSWMSSSGSMGPGADIMSKRSLYNWTKSFVVILGTLLNVFSIDEGLHCALSSILFETFNDRILRQGLEDVQSPLVTSGMHVRFFLHMMLCQAVYCITWRGLPLSANWLG